MGNVLVVESLGLVLDVISPEYDWKFIEVVGGPPDGSFVVYRGIHLGLWNQDKFEEARSFKEDWLEEVTLSGSLTYELSLSPISGELVYRPKR